MKSNRSSVERHHESRIKSEGNLNEILPFYFAKDKSYFVLSNGDVDQIAYLRLILKQQRIKELYIASWVISITDAEQLLNFVERGYIEQIDFYLHNIFRTQYSVVYQFIKKNFPKSKLRIFNNHSKLVFGSGEKFDFAICSSANLNTNRRCEQTCIYTNTQVFNLYKKYYGNQEYKKAKQAQASH